MPNKRIPKKTNKKQLKKQVVSKKYIKENPSPVPASALSNKWLDAQDMKLLFKVTDNTLYNWRKWKIIQGSKTGRGYLYNEGQVHAMLINNLGKGLLLFGFNFI